MSANPQDEYQLLDSGNGRKLEQFGPHRLARPAAQAVWRPQRDERFWATADASFDREEGNRWHNRSALPDAWVIRVGRLRFKLSATEFGHLGIFPEQRALWQWLGDAVRRAGRPVSVLNLFAYSGGATLAAAAAGAEVCHLDASKGMVEWARANAALNGLEKAPVRWIVEDAHKFLDREDRRGRRYEGIILDPPTFGHGRRGEVYKLEEALPATVEKCRRLLSARPLFMLLTSHTPLCTPTALANLLRRAMEGGGKATVESGEMLLGGAPDVLPLPSGSYARWTAGAAPNERKDDDRAELPG